MCDECCDEQLRQRVAELEQQRRKDREDIAELRQQRREDREYIAELEQTIEQLATEATERGLRLEGLENRVDDVEAEQQKDTENRKDLAQNTNEAVDTATEAKEIAKSASAVANQAKSMVEEDDETDKTPTPEGVKPASSPLDFFANCREAKLKERLVERYNQKNDFRAVLVAKQWTDFAIKTRGETIAWTRDCLRTALTAVMGEKPHGTTVSRVWDSLTELGGDDVIVKRKKISNKQDAEQIIKMHRGTAEQLLDQRYHQFDLLDDTLDVQSGVTPVVTGETAASA
jgi:hypothetical protein